MKFFIINFVKYKCNLSKLFIILFNLNMKKKLIKMFINQMFIIKTFIFKKYVQIIQFILKFNFDKIKNQKNKLIKYF